MNLAARVCVAVLGHVSEQTMFQTLQDATDAAGNGLFTASEAMQIAKEAAALIDAAKKEAAKS